MTASDVTARPMQSTWLSARWWLGLAALIVIAGLGLALTSPAPGRPLDPSSPSKNGTEALNVLLTARGTMSHAVTSVAAALESPSTATIVITAPDDFSDGQLRALAESGHRLVAVAPSQPALAVLAPDRSARYPDAETAAPDCAWAGAQAAGSVDLPPSAQTYTGADGCYGGLVIFTPTLVILGTTDLLTNAHLGESHLAAVAINALSDDGAVTSLTWLLPGVDAEGAGSPTIWSIFPPWVGRAAWWLAFVAILLVLWRGRRLGPVVREPLPVVVRAAEIVEGHGRLYFRARARDRAASALRAATVHRLARRLRLPSSAGAEQVAALIGPQGAVLRDSGALPDERALLQLARDMRDLENQSNGETRE